MPATRHESRTVLGSGAGDARRLVRLERSYRCEECGGERRSWTRLRTCPDCGEPLTIAVIRRAALA
jgi:hypothetical protein